MHADLYTACVHSVRGEAIDKKCDLTADYSVSDARISIGAGRYRYATVRTVKKYRGVRYYRGRAATDCK